jgi:hypothetical protein
VAVKQSVCVLGSSRTPRYPVRSFRLQGRTVGIISRRFHRTGVSALSSSLARCGGSQAGRNSKELGAVFGLCGDVFDYVQLAPLHFKGQNHHIDNTRPGTHHTQASLSDRDKQRQRDSLSPSPASHLPRTRVQGAPWRADCPYISTYPTRCLDFGPWSPESHAPSPLTATTTTTTTTTPNLTSGELSVALRPQLNLLGFLSGLALPGRPRLGPYWSSRSPGLRLPRASIPQFPTSRLRARLIRVLRNGRIFLVAASSHRWPSSATGHCDFPWERLDDTSWRDIFNTDKQRRQVGRRAPSKIPVLQLRCCRSLLKLPQIALGGHSTCWFDRERVQAHGWTRRAHRADT